MHVRSAAFVLLLSSLSACAASSSPPPGSGCEALVDHAALLRVERRLDAIPEAEREAHRDTLTEAITPALRATCDRMTASERSCWRDAASAEALERCVVPSPDDVAALATAARMTYDGEPTPPPNPELSRQEP